MIKFEDFKKAGRFELSSGLEVIGEISLAGSSTKLDLYSKESFETYNEKDLTGEFLDRSKVSMINCITKTSSVTGENYNFHSSVFPHFIIFGDMHIRSSDEVIHRVSFTVDDAAEIFYDHDAFGVVLDSRPHMERIAQDNIKGRMVEIGEYPHLFYFSGKHEILKTETVLGNISVSHGISYTFPSPKGISLKNKISVNIKFHVEKNVENAIVSVLDILRFLEIDAGRPQNISDLRFMPRCTEEAPKVLDVYWCMPPKRSVESESPQPHPAGVLMQEIFKKGEFGRVLRAWLEKNNAWRDARLRFSTSFGFQRGYYVDRLVGAANMFDILPSSACPIDVPLEPNLLRARDEARKLFASLEDSPERNSVLGALGRIGKPTLKKKVQARAAIVSAVLGERFTDLKLVLYQAVDCRNYYVHGTPGKFDYSKNSAQVTFFIRTLEFVFAASDLIECGWDMKAWMRQGPMHSHPFAEYLDIYDWEVKRLKTLLRLEDA